jgi:hypothetical protein
MKNKTTMNMKTIRKFSQNIFRILSFILTAVFMLQCQPARSEKIVPVAVEEKGQRIMLALLLDTSNSMDGLIDQAKSQLWKIVNELSAAKCSDGTRPSIRIALYEYGNDGLPSSEGYIRLVSPLTNDLDLISEKLFSLTTNGGNEYCGYVINTALKQLDWSTSEADLKMVFIAGNEPFTQGPIPYKTACALAKEKDVVINTIFCGSMDEGIQTSWKSGADITGGNFMSIEQNRKTVYIESPYDKKIEALNDQLNDTYVQYGKSGAAKKEQQRTQDRNAEHYGAANKVERAVSKSSHVYENSSWDLVDAAKDDEKVITETKEEHLPAEMKSMTVEQRKNYVQQKSEQRSKIQKEIQVLNEKRKQYIAQQSASKAMDETLDAAMIKAVKEKAKAKKLSL